MQGKDGWKPTVLRSWSRGTTRCATATTISTNLTIWRMATVLNGSMTDHFFQITMDVQVHPEYAARPEAALANSSIRFTLFEAPPADLSKPETSLNMVNYDAAYMGVLTGGNEWDVLTRRHRMTWGLVTDDTHTDGSFPSLSTNILTGAAVLVTSPPSTLASNAWRAMPSLPVRASRSSPDGTVWTTAIDTAHSRRRSARYHV